MWRILVTFFLIVCIYSPVSADGCFADISTVLSKRRVKSEVDMTIERAQKVLNRTRSMPQVKVQALRDVINMHPGSTYTAEVVLKQNNALRKAGFLPEEIETLRRKRVLGNTVVSYANGTPTGIVHEAAALEELGVHAIKDLKDGKRLKYVLSEDGSIYISKDPMSYPSDKIIMLTNKQKDIDGRHSTIVVRELGELNYSNGAGITFKPVHGFDASDLGKRELMDNVTASNPGSRFSYTPSPNLPVSNTIKCLDILSGQSRGKNFVLDRVLSENLVTTSAIVVSEVAGASRLESETGRKVVIADLVGGTVNNILGATVGKKLVLQNSNFATSMVTRTGVGYGMTKSQELIHSSFLGEDSENVASDIAGFNMGHFLFRLPVNHYFDNFVMKTLPIWLYSKCQKNSSLSIAVSPRAIRIYERYASAVIYYGARQAIVGQ